MSDVLDGDTSIELNVQSTEVGVDLSLQSSALRAQLDENRVTADLVAENLILRLYQPGGVPEPDDPFFDSIPGSGELSQEEKDAITKAAADAAVAEAMLEIQRSADDIATSVLANASAILANTLEARVQEISATFQSKYLSVAIYEQDVGARVDDKAAAIQNLLETYVDTDSALAQKVETVAAGTQQALAAVQETNTAFATADTAIGQRIDAVVADVSTNRAAIITVDDARADDYQATANRLDSLESKVSVDVDAKIQTISQTVANNYSATATQIQSVTTTLNGHTSTINVQQQSINGVSARYGVQLDVNGWMVGWVANNSGQGSGSVVITADKFVVAYPGYDAIAPFQISFNNGRSQVSMHAAYITDATIGTAKIANLAVTNAKIGDAQITTAKIADLQVSNAKIQDGAITNAKIGNAEITTAKIGEAQVDTLRIGANAVSTMVPFSGTGNWTYRSGGGQMVIMISAFCGSSDGVGGTATINVGGVSTSVSSVYENKGASFIQATLGVGDFGVSISAGGRASGVFAVILEVKR
jgi:hypothetical protein